MRATLITAAMLLELMPSSHANRVLKLHLQSLHSSTTDVSPRREAQILVNISCIKSYTDVRTQLLGYGLKDCLVHAYLLQERHSRAEANETC